MAEMTPRERWGNPLPRLQGHPPRRLLGPRPRRSPPRVRGECGCECAGGTWPARLTR